MSRARDVANRTVTDNSVTSDKIADGTIVNADVSASAAIAATKLSGVVANTIVDAKGDLLVGTAADTISRVGVGTNGQFLQANSSAASGVQWAAALTGTSVTDVVALTQSAYNALSPKSATTLYLITT